MVWWKKAKTDVSPTPENATEPDQESTIENAEQVADQPHDETAPADDAQAVDEAPDTDETTDADGAEDATDADDAEEEPSPETDEADTADTVDEADKAAEVDDEVADDSVAEDAPPEAVEETQEFTPEDQGPEFTAPEGVASLTDCGDMVSETVTSSADAPVVAVKRTSQSLSMALTVVGSVLGAILLVVGCGAVGTSYFNSHAKPGTELAGFNLTGFSTTQVRNVAATLIETYTANLELNGHKVKATAKDLGITFDLDKTVTGAMNAGSAAEISAKYNPFNTKQAPLVMSIDKDRLEEFLNTTFIADKQRAVPASVEYDADQQLFAVQPGKDGTEADAAQVIEDLKAGKGIGSALTVATTTELPPITDATAQQVADAVNQYVTATYTLTAQDMSYTLPASAIASWVRFTPDVEKGTIEFTLDTEQATAEIPSMLTENLTKPVTNQKIMVAPSGTVLGVQQRGSAGTEVADPSAATADVVQALTAGAGASLAVNTVSKPFASEQVSMPPEYLQAGGARWVEVNRSNFTLTRWEGTSKISTWTVNIGKPSTPTFAGIFHVWAKVRIQDMRGSDYLQPDVPWVAYFDGDNALHGNYWVDHFGWGSSHGCVGIPVAQAETLYNWISVGDLVVVHD